MNNQIKVLIADDNKAFSDILKKILEKNNQIKVIGIAYTDKEEIEQIENNKPDVVITDLLRGKEYSGMDIIKEYKEKDNSIKFFIISSDANLIKLNNMNNVIGYMKKPFIDYDYLINYILETKKDKKSSLLIILIFPIFYYYLIKIEVVYQILHV